MSRFRVGTYSSLIMDMGYVISEEALVGMVKIGDIMTMRKMPIEDAKMLESEGHIADWYI